MTRKATGIVRRIDDLGRVVIPKEVRKTLRIREGEPLEIFVESSGEVILKKYSPISDLGDFANEYVESLKAQTGHIAIVTDRDIIVSVAGSKEFREKDIGNVIEACVEQRQTITEMKGGNHEISSGFSTFISSYIVTPILTGSGDIIGTVVLLSLIDKIKLGTVEVKLAEVAASYLARLMEG